jgi:hypothetical protein
MFQVYLQKYSTSWFGLARKGRIALLRLAVLHMPSQQGRVFGAVTMFKGASERVLMHYAATRGATAE